MRITDFPELVTATGNDLLVTVDIANDVTKKIKLENLPTSIATTVALATKQNLLVSGTNIKTVNSTSLLGSGDIALQPTLVSGTNIKTLNSVSLLGSGDIVLTANPSGVAGAIQFSDGSAFASDAANFFWNNTTKRLGIGTNAPTGKTQITESFTTTGNNYSAITFDGILTSRATASDTIFGFRNTQSIVATALGQTIIANDLTPNYTFFDANTDSIGLRIGGLKNTQNNSTAILMQQTATAGNNGLAIQPANSRWQIGFCSGQSNQIQSARVVYGPSGIRIATSSAPANNLFEIIGTGSTSATTSLLVQNSAGVTGLEVKDNLKVGMGGAFSDGASGFGTIVASISANYPCFLMNSTSSSSKIGFNMDTAKLYFSEETNGSSLFGHRIMADTRIGGLVVKNDTTAGATASLNASAVLQADSTTRGFLPPRMTTTQKNAIASPATGLVVMDITTFKLCVYNGTSWVDLH